MYRRQIQKHLSYKIIDDFVLTEEYQDKYYFKKLVQEAFPLISDKAIYSSIEQCNLLISKPRKKSDYLKLFSQTLMEKIQIESR